MYGLGWPTSIGKDSQMRTERRPDKNLERVNGLLQEGYNIKGIARIACCSTSWMYRWLRRNYVRGVDGLFYPKRRNSSDPAHPDSGGDPQ